MEAATSAAGAQVSPVWGSGELGVTGGTQSSGFAGTTGTATGTGTTTGAGAATGTGAGTDAGSSGLGVTLAPPGAASRFMIKMPGRVVDLPDTHWAFALVQAVLSGDSHLTERIVDAAGFDPATLTTPLDGVSGVTIVHVAALANQPAVLHALVRAAERVLVHNAVKAQQLAVRQDAVRPTHHDPHANMKLLNALDAYSRLGIMRAEQLYIDLVSCKDARGRTALHYAACARGVMVESLLEYEDARFRRARGEGGQPLFPHGCFVSPSTGALWHPAAAAAAPDDETAPAVVAPPDGFVSVATLEAMRYDPAFIDAADDDGATALIYATVADDTRAIKCLLEYGADDFAHTADGLTALDLASNRVVRSALVPMDSAVHAACGIPHVRAGTKSPARRVSKTTPSRMQASTVASGAQQAVHDESDDTARRLAAENALMLLVSSGEDINGRAGIHMRAPLHVAAEQGAVDVVQLLLNNGAIVDIVDVNGCTPLHLAAELGTPVHQRVVRLLAEAGADINATTSVRKTALHVAATGGPTFSVEVALAAGPSALVATRGRVVAEGGVAATSGDPERTNSDGGRGMILLLTRLGCNLEGVDTENNTALHAAAKRGNFLAADMLLTLGARIYSTNIRGHTALHVAAFHHHIPVVRLLCRWDAEIGKLKHVLDSSGRSAYDMAADTETRDALHTLFEACAVGKLDLAQSVARAGATVSPANQAAWHPVQPWEVTRILRRTCLHATITGAARALAMYRAQHKTPASGGNRTGTSGASAAPQRRDPTSPRKRTNPSAIHIVAGMGFRFVPTLTVSSGVPEGPAHARTVWGGSPSDVQLSFFEPENPSVRLYLDPYAYTPPRDRGQSVGDNKTATSLTSVAALAARRQVPGSELTSTQVEKEFGRVVDWLVRAGAQVNDADIDGVTPVMLAARYGLLFILRRLLTHGANARLADREGNTAFHYAHAFHQQTAAGILEEFVDTSADPVPRSNAGFAPSEAAGNGIQILPDCSERLVTIDPPPPRSATLHVSRAV